MRTMHTAGTSATVAPRTVTAHAGDNGAAYGGGNARPDTARDERDVGAVVVVRLVARVRQQLHLG